MAAAFDRAASMLIGRMPRRFYWLWTVVYIAIQTACRLSGLPTLLVLVAFPLVWILLIAAPRLHDMGRSLAWGFVPMAGGFVLGFIKGFVLATQRDVLTPEDIQNWNNGVGIAMGLLTIVFMVLLGAVPGQEGSNRFGPRPGTSKGDPATAFD